MYLSRISIRNFRGIEELDWELPPKAPRAGWHVFIGDNGVGKSSVLRAAALALVGWEEAPMLRLNWNDWVRFGTSSAKIHLRVETDPKADRLPDRSTVKGPLRVGVDVLRHPKPRVVGSPQWRTRGAPPESNIWWSPHGWFSASYGPFRRFTGGDREWEKLLEAQSRVARHLSIFGESVALTSGLKWLCELALLEYTPGGRRKSSAAPVTVDKVITFVNQPGFLPHGMHIDEVTPHEVVFRNASKARVPAENLSDGYRAVLSITFELLRQLSLAYPKLALFDKTGRIVSRPGVVMIDEVDAHLHPTWQREIGPWFCKHFPNIQFIVTTHSPLVCQAAESGTVFKLAAPGTDEESRFLTGLDRERLVFGNVLEAFGTGAFGLQRTTRSRTSQARVDELAGLNAKELTDGLTKKEMARQQELRRSSPTVAYVSEPREPKA
ncbi:AAA family ATPase [Corallococcus exiguus]|nr:AAA family ATPase [Corallococcus exiguus]NNB93821.1 AAA family ATPase [Corallococcus exiguus]